MTAKFTGIIPFKIVKNYWRISNENYHEVFYTFMVERKTLKLIEDIKKYGMKEPIILNSDGVVLEGRHRYCVADLLHLQKVPFVYEEKPLNSIIQEFAIKLEEYE